MSDEKDAQESTPVPEPAAETTGGAEPEPSAAPAGPARPGQARRFPWGPLLALIVVVLAVALIPIVRLASGEAWNNDRRIATYILAGVIVGLEIIVIILLKTARTRYSVERQIVEHREVHEYVILWNRPRWILYTPTMVLSLVFGITLALRSAGIVPQAVPPRVLGGIWVVLCMLNVLVEQFHMSVKVVFIVVPTLGAALLVLHLFGYADEAIRLVRFTAVDVPPKLYLLAALMICLIIFIGWMHGLFHYMAITPNMADLQRGLTETGRQIKNDDYDVDFDATDVVERWLFGFGRMIISFRDPNRPAMVFFVPRAHRVDDLIRRVRSVTAIDRPPEDL
jgi:hypothetical protein